MCCYCCCCFCYFDRFLGSRAQSNLTERTASRLHQRCCWLMFLFAPVGRYLVRSGSKHSGSRNYFAPCPPIPNRPSSHVKPQPLLLGPCKDCISVKSTVESEDGTCSDNVNVTETPTTRSSKPSCAFVSLDRRSGWLGVLGRGRRVEGPQALARRACHGPSAHGLHAGQLGLPLHGHPPDVVLLQALT